MGSNRPNPNYRTGYIIPRKIAEKVLREAICSSTSVEVDELNCSKSFSRVDTDKTVAEVLSIGLGHRGTLYNFIFRDMSFMGEEDYFDVGLCTCGFGETEYFLWIRLGVQEGERIIREFDLKPL